MRRDHNASLHIRTVAALIRIKTSLSPLIMHCFALVCTRSHVIHYVTVIYVHNIERSDDKEISLMASDEVEYLIVTRGMIGQIGTA